MNDMAVKTIIVGIEFNNRSKPNNRWKIGLTKQWIDYRMSVFMKYTLSSLKKQTNPNFHVLVRYAKESEELVHQALGRYKPLPRNVRFIAEEQYNETMKELCQNSKYVYLVRLDCDDTYHKTMIHQLHRHKPKPGVLALINQRGYIYDSTRHRICAIRKKSPPFYTFVYVAEEYFNGKRYPTPGGHGSVIKLRHEVLTTAGRRNYMIVVHKRNTLNQNLLKHRKFITNRTRVGAIIRNFI